MHIWRFGSRPLFALSSFACRGLLGFPIAKWFCKASYCFVRSECHADTLLFGCCQYAKARNDDEIADESLIDAALNEEEAEMLELLGVGNYLGDLGGSILSGKAPPKAAKETKRAMETDGSGDVAPPSAARSEGSSKHKSGKASKRAADDDDDEDDDYPVFSREFFRIGIIRGIFNRKSCRGNLRFLRALL